jgi:glucosamine--fructose-6-phosphate aminotransferase (isomerizing)
VVAVTDQAETGLSDKAEIVLVTPKIIDDLMPVLTTIPLQLLSYHIAVLKGTDVDQPRNLAKSVTVE